MSREPRIRALIVDDEPWARRRIATLLAAEPDLEVVGECEDGAEAIAKINELAPDLVFLDVQMPEISGFDVIEAIGPECMPRVIFATAYESYALRAFEAQALDYLLKPFDEERFRKALERARKELRRADGGMGAELRALIESLGGARRHLRRLLVRTSGRVLFLKVGEIDWLEAADNYVAIHVGQSTHLLRETLQSLEQKLDPDQFARVHRSLIVNLDRVKELQPWFKGEQALLLKDGTRLTVGRAFRARIERLMANSVD